MLNVSNVANKVTLKGIVNRVFLEIMFFSKHNSNTKLLYSGLCRRCGKGRHWTNECRSKKDIQGDPMLWGELLEGPLTGPYAKFSSIVSCHHRGNSFPEQLKNLMPIVRNQPYYSGK